MTNELFEQETDLVAKAVAAALRETAPYQSAMIAYGYHQLVEAVMHPHNAEAIDVVREVAGLTKAHGEHPDMALSKMAADALAVCEFLGIEPEHTCGSSAEEEDYLAETVKERVRPMVERAFTAQLEDLPTTGKPN